MPSDDDVVSLYVWNCILQVTGLLCAFSLCYTVSQIGMSGQARHILPRQFLGLLMCIEGVEVPPFTWQVFMLVPTQATRSLTIDDHLDD